MRTHEFNQQAFSELTPESAYWLGFIAADGYISDRHRAAYVRLKLAEKDVSHLIAFRNFMESSKEVSYSEGYPYITFSSVDLVKSVKEYLPAKNKSSMVDIPDIPKELVGDFIRGFFDGDGWTTWGVKPALTLGIVSNGPIIESIHGLLSAEGIKCRFVKDKRSGAFSVLMGAKKSISDFYEFTHGQSELRLDRKWTNIEERISIVTDGERSREANRLARSMLSLGKSYSEVESATGIKRNNLYALNHRRRVEEVE